ncbi:2-[(L-alanin-3-ylcarbamoyl)methyl]-2-hydroxybutanedioate decarboxylase [Pseudoalteromonas sp. CIP111854]|uniref:2-[(L-alanin-3-ylcarbamoyl)methyl]-2-hydroxybutanedioate decarboxylase n=1 Tax=Pseudoalteromonas holothuriae TaxID=2963714 RepID=A0A9W4QVS4_9GAMM|nr:PLP-dependent decarboxylase [Pseudoalteromonas sp. CIP111854]CAH9055453.1 2-[(L-alanin-3-ylcarbamoyl)methyl]-2-hydroxybutanedioate decarboxylase [Pseudoalteromonas sp. CIP111854]
MSFLSTAHRQVIEQITQTEQAPFFVYDLDGLLSHLKPLTEQSVVKLWYAVKANPLSKVIQTLDKAGFDFDVASAGELEQVLAQGVSSSRVLNTGPAKSKRQIQYFLSQGVRTFVAESLNQVNLLNLTACEQELELQVLLRVQLRWPEGEKNPLGGDSLTPFGLGIEQWQALDITAFPALHFTGLHIFQWGNMLSTPKLAALWSQMVEPLVTLANTLGFKLKVLDLGGGLGIPYHEYDACLNWPHLLDALASIKAAAGVDELWMELGRYAVGEYGHYVDPIIEQKQNYGEHQLIIAGGINHILRPAVTSQDFPCELLRQSAAPTSSYLLHGPLCTALDHLGRHNLPNDMHDNDWIVFSQCGAYGFTESMPFFLCHELPAEYVIENNTVNCIRTSQSASTYLR